MRAATLDSRLEAIAGPPVAWSDVPGAVVLHPPLGETQGRTIYAVTDVLADGPTQQYIFKSGITGGQVERQFVRTGGVGAWDSGARWGVATPTFRTLGARITGARQVVCSWLPDDFDRLWLECGSNRMASTVTDSTGGLPVDRLVLSSQSAALRPVAVYLYGTAHDAVTRARVMAWLRHHYTAI